MPNIADFVGEGLVLQPDYVLCMYVFVVYVYFLRSKTA